VLCYDATRNALAAVLSALGKRVGEGRGAHALTIREAGKALGPAHRRAIIAIEAARVARNRTEYDAQPVTQAQLESLKDAMGKARQPPVPSSPRDAREAIVLKGLSEARDQSALRP